MITNFNLQNSVSPPSTVDGHFLQVTSPFPEVGIGSAGDDFIDVINGCTLCSTILGQGSSNQKLPSGVLFESVFNLQPVAQGASSPLTPVIVATLSYQSRSVRIELQPNNQTNGSNNQSVSPKMRIRIRNEGVSFTPWNMTEFKIIYKLRW